MRKIGWFNYFNEDVKESMLKGQRYCEAGEADRGGEGNSWVETRNKENRADMAEEKREQERETIDKIPDVNTPIINQYWSVNNMCLHYFLKD